MPRVCESNTSQGKCGGGEQVEVRIETCWVQNAMKKRMVDNRKGHVQTEHEHRGFEIRWRAWRYGDIQLTTTPVSIYDRRSHI